MHESHACGSHAAHALTSSVVVDAGLGKHGVVLDLRLADGGAVAGDEDQLGCRHSREAK